MNQPTMRMKLAFYKGKGNKDNDSLSLCNFSIVEEKRIIF